MSPLEKSNLHSAYVNLTGLEVRLDQARERDWYEWKARGFGTDDLRLVVGHLRKTIKEPRILASMLRFGFLIGQWDRFEEILAEARVALRPRAPATATVRTGTTERIVPSAGTADTSRRADEIAEGMAPGSRWNISPQTLEEWKKMKDTL